jgi:DNA replication and repair protein RecF
MMPARLRRLTLTNFRSYHSAKVEVGAGPVVLVGPNGAGKTNLLEAISWLAPGRGQPSTKWRSRKATARGR